MTDSAETLIAYCRENNRVCPLPQLWNQLWEMLSERRRDGSSWKPSLPLILAAWHDTPAMLKMLRLAEHIEWAAQHGVLESISNFLREMREEDWFQIGR